MAEKWSGAGEAQATTQLLFVLFWAAAQSKQSRVGKRRGCVTGGKWPLPSGLTWGTSGLPCRGLQLQLTPVEDSIPCQQKSPKQASWEWKITPAVTSY